MPTGHIKGREIGEVWPEIIVWIDTGPDDGELNKERNDKGYKT